MCTWVFGCVRVLFKTAGFRVLECFLFWKVWSPNRNMGMVLSLLIETWGWFLLRIER